MRVAVSADVLSILPLLIVLALLGGCDVRTTSELPATPLLQRIVNGAPTQQHPAVVHLEMQLEAGERAYCSGSLVGRDRVLTAAHCLPDHFWIADIPRKIEKVHVYFSTDASQPAMREASRWERNPLAQLRDKLQQGDAGVDEEMAPDAGPPRPAFGVEAYVGRYDTAVVYLAEPAPENIEPLRVTFELPSDNQLKRLEARIVGFGASGVRRDGTLIDPGIKREGTPRILGLSELTDGLDFYTNTVTIAAADGGVAAGCKNDSGGPLQLQFAQDDWRIIAVTSWGEQFCDGEVHYATLAESEDFLRGRI